VALARAGNNPPVLAGGGARGIGLIALLATLAQAGPAPVYQPPILAEYPHDATAFTQGLFVHQGRLYESTGLYGQSRLRLLELNSGRILLSRALSPELFAEGADWCGDEIIQLTWTAGRALRYDPQSLQPRGEYHYAGEGWGLACQDDTWVTSDGSATLTFRNPTDFRPERTLQVTDHQRPIPHLNELEWVDDQLLANVWQSPRIAVIDPQSGRVRLWLDLRAAVRRSGRAGNRFVLNGIAWDAESQQLYITGKGWNRVYRIGWPNAARQARLWHNPQPFLIQ
jgi:glutamine cyclotransferase